MVGMLLYESAWFLFLSRGRALCVFYTHTLPCEESQSCEDRLTGNGATVEEWGLPGGVWLGPVLPGCRPSCWGCWRVLGGRREASNSSSAFPGLFLWLSTQKVLGRAWAPTPSCEKGPSKDLKG